MSDVELTVHIPIGDWHEDVQRAESFITDKAQLLNMVKQGSKTGELVKAAVVSQELGMTTERITRPNKKLLYQGAYIDVVTTIQNNYHIVTAPNGTEYKASDFVGMVREPEPETKAVINSDTVVDAFEVTPLVLPVDTKLGAYVTSYDPLASQRAQKYLMQTVPGHVWNHLITVYENGGDVANTMQQLVVKLQEMVSRLQ